jgi:hypothetical protein
MVMSLDPCARPADAPSGIAPDRLQHPKRGNFNLCAAGRGAS